MNEAAKTLAGIALVSVVGLVVTTMAAFALYAVIHRAAPLEAGLWAGGTWLAHAIWCALCEKVLDDE